MKKIPKKLLDDYIEASRNYWHNTDPSDSVINKNLNIKREASFKLSKAIDVDWLCVTNFIDGILQRRGFCPDAENDEIYCALHVLGWMEVAESEAEG